MRATGVLSFVLVALLPLAASQDPGQDITCSATKQCAVGCCGTYGICGMGPEFCGPGNCINNCDRKSECDPANWGPTYAANTACPLNVCCSRFGFCGTTEEFCGGNVVASPSCSGNSAAQRTIGYFEGWGITRPCGAIFPEDLVSGAYTHLNFAFALIDPNTFQVAPMIDTDRELYSRLTNLKVMNPGLQVWISIGGWSMNDPGPTRTTFSDLAGSVANQQRFFSSLISMMTTYGFDGVDIDWEYPGADDRGGRPEDVKNFPAMLRNMRSAFAATGHNWGITVTFPSSFWYLQHFDVKAIEQAVDWINMMTYDIHGTWDAINQWEGPYVKAHTNLSEIDEGLKLLWRNNINPSNVVLGLGFYGRSFKLADPSCTSPGCVFTAGGDAGPCTQSEGTLGYAEIQQLIQGGYTPRLDSQAAAQILVYGDDNWVSYDDATTLKMKVDFANRNCLGGTMVWAASLDDKAGTAARALAGATGQLDDFNVGIVKLGDGLGSCLWTACSTSCPAGYTVAESTWPANPLGCPGAVGGKVNARLFCCPFGQVPECQWRVEADTNAGTCNGQCQSGEIAVASTNQLFGIGENLCPNGGQVSMCCKGTNSLNIWAKCTWAGSPPLCGASANEAAACPSDFPNKLTQTLRGDGGAQSCTLGYRSLCCQDPPPVRNCQWYRNAFHNVCTPGCPAGKVEMATDNQAPSCASGYGSFCCDPALGSLGSRSVQDFAEFVNRWIRDGVCDSHLLTRRSITSPTVSARQFGGQQVSDSDMAAVLYPLLKPGVFLNSEQQADLDVWNDSVQNASPEFHALTSGNLQVLAAGSPDGDDGDPIGSLADLFCCLGDCVDGFLAMVAVPTSGICEVIPTGTSSKRTLSDGDETTSLNETSLNKRVFNEFDWYSGEGPFNPQVNPGVGHLLQAIIDGRVRPEFYNFFRFGQNLGNGPSASTDFEMEIVYLLGTGTTGMDQSLMGPTGQPFAVFHIHFAGGANYANGPNTQGLGITSINVAHGRYISRRGRAGLQGPADGAWVLNGRTNPRDIFNCATQRNTPRGSQRAYRHWNQASRNALRGGNAVNQLLFQFIEHVNGLGGQGVDLLRGQSAATLVRNWGVPVQPNRHVFNTQTSRWNRQPNSNQFEFGTDAIAPGNAPYDPRYQHGGDLWNDQRHWARRS